MDGFVNVLKAPGMTSSNAVYDVRGIFSEKRAGHLGTLDPGAAGVLPIALGRAARLFDLLVEKEKTYLFELILGVSTDTFDAYGTVTATADCDITPDQLNAVLPRFAGETRQLAPAYSALKVDGRKMYDLAREGDEVPERTRSVAISELTVIEQLAKNRYLLRVRCSRGTYVRALARDIGLYLGVPAHLSFLLRTAAGPFTLENAHSIAALAQKKTDGTLADAVISCEDALAFLPSVTLQKRRRTPTMNALETSGVEAADGPARVYCGGFMGVGEVKNGCVRLRIHLY